MHDDIRLNRLVSEHFGSNLLPSQGTARMAHDRHPREVCRRIWPLAR